MLINKHIRELRTALAQHGDQKPSAYLTIADTGDMVWPPEAYDEACTYCDDDENPVPLYMAAPAPQAQEWKKEPEYVPPLVKWAQDVPEVGFGNTPYSPYLFGGLRFKMNFDKSGNATNFHGVESALQGAWVALVDATDNRHLQSAQPVARPLTLEQLLDIVKKLGEPT